MNIKLKESRQKEETVLRNKDGWLFVTTICGSHPSLHLTEDVMLPLTLNFMWFGKYFHKKGKKLNTKFSYKIGWSIMLQLYSIK